LDTISSIRLNLLLQVAVLNDVKDAILARLLGQLFRYVIPLERGLIVSILSGCRIIRSIVEERLFLDALPEGGHILLLILVLLAKLA
jgi:hypothetical protein